MIAAISGKKYESVLKKGGNEMPNVKKVGEVYRCEVCGNVVEVKKVGGGELVCCGQPMTLEKEGK